MAKLEVVAPKWQEVKMAPHCPYPMGPGKNACGDKIYCFEFKKMEEHDMFVYETKSQFHNFIDFFSPSFWRRPLKVAPGAAFNM